MLTLKTGLPRNGKTLSAVTELAALLKRWEKHPEERRPVYQFGVTGLTLESIAIQAWPADGNPGDPIPLTPKGKPACHLTFDESAIPDGSLIIIDECQDFYPPRGPSQKPPQHVAELNTHGHRDLDYLLMTQHPKLIDNAVRRLVNKHQHYRRAFGGGSAITYEWDACSDNLLYRSAIKGIFRYPKKSFAFYTSASGFTKPSFKIPAFFAIPLLAIPLGIYALPTAFQALSGAATGKGVSLDHPVMPAASSPIPTGERKPQSPQGAASSPVVPVVTYAGCIAMADRCACVTATGGLEDRPEQCEFSSRQFGGLVALDMHSTSATSARQSLQSPEPVLSVPLGISAGDPRYNPKQTPLEGRR